jgi:hypothetical protein
MEKMWGVIFPEKMLLTNIDNEMINEDIKFIQGIDKLFNPF